jgi:hypothetical protein
MSGYQFPPRAEPLGKLDSRLRANLCLLFAQRWKSNGDSRFRGNDTVDLASEQEGSALQMTGSSQS